MRSMLIFGAEDTQAEGIAALGLDPRAFLVQLATFLLVFYVLKRFVFGRVVKVLEDRQKTIAEGIELTSRMQTEKQLLEEESASTRKKARVEADKILADSHEQAGAMLKEAEEAAQRKIDALLADAHKKIEEDTERARRELEKDIAELIIQATEVVAKEKIDAKKDADLISRALGASK